MRHPFPGYSNKGTGTATHTKLSHASRSRHVHVATIRIQPFLSPCPRPPPIPRRRVVKTDTQSGTSSRAPAPPQPCKAHFQYRDGLGMHIGVPLPTQPAKTLNGRTVSNDVLPTAALSPSHMRTRSLAMICLRERLRWLRCYL